MQMRTAALLLILAASQYCAPKHPISDWRYTQWGMDTKAVIAASLGTAVPSAPADQSADRSKDAKVRLRAPVSWLGQTFTAFFGFTAAEERLASITLQLTDPSEASAALLRANLGQLYGSPSSAVERTGIQLLSWSLPAEQIAFIRLTDPSAAVGAPVTSVSYQASTP